MGDNILLWENCIARSNKQNYYEGFFCGIIYICILVLGYYIAYKNLAVAFYRYQEIYHVLPFITIVYYLSIFLILFFLTFFTNEHDIAYKKATLSAINLSKKSKENKGDKNLRRSKIIRISVLLIIVLLIPISLYPLIRCSKLNINSMGKTYDYIIVLGNKSPGSEPSEDMKCRLNCLLSNMDAFSNSTIVLSGGNGEAEKMYTVLLNNGITSNSIILEELSKNTLENLENTRSLVTGNVLVITSDYHAFRTKLICYMLDLNWDILSTKTNSFKRSKSLKECYSTYYEYLKAIFK